MVCSHACAVHYYCSFRLQLNHGRPKKIIPRTRFVEEKDRHGHTAAVRLNRACRLPSLRAHLCDVAVSGIAKYTRVSYVSNNAAATLSLVLSTSRSHAPRCIVISITRTPVWTPACYPPRSGVFESMLVLRRCWCTSRPKGQKKRLPRLFLFLTPS